MSLRSPHDVVVLLEKMDSPDADFRYMALNDLMAEARKDAFSAVGPAMQDKAIERVLELIKDKNGEVKNMSVKCLGMLVKTVRDKQMQTIVDRLVEYVSSKEEDLRDIASLGLKTVMAEVPADSELAVSAGNKLVPRLLAQVRDPSASQEVLIDSLDVIADYFTRFQNIVATNVPLQADASQVLLTALSHSRATVRKRAMLGLGALGACSTSEVFTGLAEFIAATLVDSDSNTSSVEVTKAVIQLLGTLARTCPRRLGRRLPEFMPRVLAITMSQRAEQDDELREVCLQALESILLRCHTEVTPFVTQIVETSVELTKYDPNYAGGDEDSDEEMAEDDDIDEDDDFVDDEYSDDDDLSWKVRRASAKVLHTTITTRSELLSSFASTVAPTLVSRFSEREESVRLEILGTFLAFLRQVQLFGGGAQATEVMRPSPGALKRKRETIEAEVNTSSPRAQLESMRPAIAKALSKQVVSKSMPTRFSSYAVLRELINVLGGGLDAHIGLLVGQTEKAIKGAEAASGPSANLKAEILAFLRLLFRCHSPRTFEDHLPSLLSFIVSAVQGNVQRDTVEAFAVCSQLVVVLRPLPGDVITSSGAAPRSSNYKAVIEQMYTAVVARISRSDSDQEVKERGIVTLGTMLAHAGDDLSDKQQEALPLLVDRLRNEVTRLVAVKVVAEVASSPTMKGELFDSFVQESINEVATLLRKSNRVLKLSAFDCLAALLKRCGHQLTAESANLIVMEIEPLLTHESNFTLVPVALQSVNLILASNQAAAHKSVQTSILPAVYSLVRSPLLQGPGLEAVLEFLQSILHVDAGLTDEVLKNLMAALQTVRKVTSPSATHINSTVAQCIGAVVKANPPSGPVVIESAAQVINDASSHNDAELYFNLLVMGEVGRLEDFAKRRDLFDKVLGFFEAKAEDVKGAAAFAVGNMSVGNLEAFLPIIEQQIAVGDDRRRLLALSSLKELITHGKIEQLSVVADRIWAPLFEICNTTDEATRNLGAECLARLTLTDPARYLPELQVRLHDNAASTRAAVIAAIRFTLTGKESSQYDTELAPIMVEFLSLLKDSDLDVRRHAMFALNSAAHHKPSLIRAHLPVLLPSMYEQTIPRSELLRKVTMGPFTVTMDDGLELRKNAFETMYTLLDTCFAQIKIEELLGRVIAGLTDDDGIKVLCYLMLVRLAALAPANIAQHLDDVVEPMTSTLKVKLRDQATKQEVEKSTELHRAIFRAMIALQRLPMYQQQQMQRAQPGAIVAAAAVGNGAAAGGVGGGTVAGSARFDALVREARSGNALYREVENGVRADAVGGGGGFGYNGMDVDG